MYIARLLLVIYFLSLEVFASELPSFEKLALLRFGNEAKLELVGNEIDLDKLGSKAYFHVFGELKYLPGEWLEASHVSSQAFEDFLSRASTITLAKNIYINPKGQIKEKLFLLALFVSKTL